MRPFVTVAAPDRPPREDFGWEGFMSRVVHFEIPSVDPARTESFYGKAFGWKFTKWDGPMEYWFVTTGNGDSPGIDGGMALRRDPGQRLANTISVESVDDAVLAVERNGGRIVAPKSAIPGVGWLAYFEDPDGNPFGLMQADPDAK
jgi:predicted enzyme related to lactoylglutathione lyase